MLPSAAQLLLHPALLAAPLVKAAAPAAQAVTCALIERRALAEKRAAAEARLGGVLRAPATAAWHLGAFPKPKSTPPGPPAAPAHAMPTNKPPSNRAFYRDVLQSMADPARGARLGVPK